jgi:hypothetical protein
MSEERSAASGRRGQRVLERRLADRAGVPAPLPSPQDARGFGEQRLHAFLKRHGCPGRKPAGFRPRRGNASVRTGGLAGDVRL